MSRLGDSSWKALVAAVVIAAAPPALAELGRSIEHNDTLGQIKDEYRYDLAPCEALRGDERTRCRVEAKQARKRDEALSEALHNQARAEAGTAQALGDKELVIQRDLALKRCDALARSEWAKCRGEVRARFGK